jgi:hypothetical protein
VNFSHIPKFRILGCDTPRPSVVDYKALTWLSLLWVPYFCPRHGASLKDLNPDTTSVSKVKCFPVSRWNTRKHTNIGKPLELWGARVIYRVEQITQRAITINKRDQVIVTMHATTTTTKPELEQRLLPELEQRLDSTLDSRQGFAYATTTKPKPL